jgi:hypothetical protein
MERQLLEWSRSVDESFAGRDYPEAVVAPPDPRPTPWPEVPGYAPYLEAWSQRPEYRAKLRPGASSQPVGGP